MKMEKSTDFAENAPARNVALVFSWPPTRIANIAANAPKPLFSMRPSPMNER